jgi:hypothetical protein
MSEIMLQFLRRMIIMLIVFVFLTPVNQLLGQSLTPNDLQETPYFFQKQFFPKTFKPANITKAVGHYSVDDWQAIIDSVWGEGLPVEQKLLIFDLFWNRIDMYFACFQVLIVNWGSLNNVYRAEILDTVSRGRFAAIMNHLALALKEAHTNIEDKLVCWNTYPDPGVPLLYVGAWGNNAHFGAGLTPLPDSSLLVYNSVTNHPLGLVPGDIILGYDGIPWKVLYKELLEAQLPIAGNWWGCSESAYTHSWLMSAGLNWHLFDTIDIVKYSSGDTIHLSTTPLIGQNEYLYCTEQMDIPGVPKPNYNAQQLVTFGIIDGTQIGYIYGWGWFWNAEDEFYDAVDSIMNSYETTGLIIDFRLNYGGNMFLSNQGLSLLFNKADTTIGFAVRSDPNNHFAMVPSGSISTFIIPGDSSSYYNKPIAVLVGPGTVSSGDQVALRMKFHPMARFFGKSTTAAFNSPVELNLYNPDWYCRYAHSDAFLVSDPNNYLTHDEFTVAKEVWLTKEDVAKGFDTVVKEAIDWIDSLTVGIGEQISETIPSTYHLFQNYPNPFNPSTTIEFALPTPGFVTLNIFNVLGEQVATLVSDNLTSGNYKVDFNAINFPSGIYFYQLRAGSPSTGSGQSFVETKKMILMK